MVQICSLWRVIPSQKESFFSLNSNSNVEHRVNFLDQRTSVKKPYVAQIDKVLGHWTLLSIKATLKMVVIGSKSTKAIKMKNIVVRWSKLSLH